MWDGLALSRALAAKRTDGRGAGSAAAGAWDCKDAGCGAECSGFCAGESATEVAGRDLEPERRCGGVCESDRCPDGAVSKGMGTAQGGRVARTAVARTIRRGERGVRSKRGCADAAFAHERASGVASGEYRMAPA